MDNKALIAYAVESDLRNDPLVTDLVAALEAAEAELARVRRSKRFYQERSNRRGSIMHAMRQQFDDLQAQTLAGITEADRPLWRRIMFQRRELRDLNRVITGLLGAAPVSLEAVKAEAPWDRTDGCFGHCDPEGWYATCLAPCDVPPPGWWCSRGRGHDGPCAAWPVSTEGDAK